MHRKKKKKRFFAKGACIEAKEKKITCNLFSMQQAHIAKQCNKAHSEEPQRT
jgi:hypothetical protein